MSEERQVDALSNPRSSGFSLSTGTANEQQGGRTLSNLCCQAERPLSILTMSTTIMAPAKEIRKLGRA